MSKKPRQKSKYLENEKRFLEQTKTLFNIIKGLLVAKNFLKPESAPLIISTMKMKKSAVYPAQKLRI